MNIDFKQEVQNHKEDLLKDLFELLSVNSVLGTDITEETPFGSGPRKALDLILSFGERDGYKTKIVENKAGHIEVGEGEEFLVMSMLYLLLKRTGLAIHLNLKLEMVKFMLVVH